MIETYLKEVEVNGQKVYKTYAKISNLKLDPNNPKDIEKDKKNDLQEFLARYDQLMPLLVDARPDKEGQLIGGNHTLEALTAIGRSEAWIEFRTPVDDADAFTIATLHNQQFAKYVESKLAEQIKKYESQIIDDIQRLEAQLNDAASFKDIVTPEKPKPFKYEIIIRCQDENDVADKMAKLSELGINAKKRGK